MNTDQNDAVQEQQPTEAVEQATEQRERVRLSPQVVEQAERQMSSGQSDKVAPEVKEAIMQRQDNKMHNPEPVVEQPEPEVEETVNDDSVNQTLREAMETEFAGIESYLSDIYSATKPDFKIQLVVPVVDTQTEPFTDSRGVQYTTDSPLASKVREGSPRGVLARTFQNLVNKIAEINNSKVLIVNNPSSQEVLNDILPKRFLNEECQMLLPDTDSGEDTFDVLAEAYEGHVPSFSYATAQGSGQTIIYMLCPIPKITQVKAGSDQTLLVPYIEKIIRRYIRTDVEIEMLLLTDSIAAVSNEPTRMLINDALDYGFSIQTFEDLLHEDDEEFDFELDNEMEQEFDEDTDLESEEELETDLDDEDEDLDEDSDEDSDEDDLDEDEDALEDDEDTDVSMPVSFDGLGALLGGSDLFRLSTIVLGKKL